ncbi:MAG: fatty acid desaturase [Myxococcales bacterium]|nr:fatty acid desaturase [Myxococcales bacterium]
MSLLKHPEDRVTVSVAFGLTALDFALYFLVDNVYLLAGYWLLLLIPKGTLSAWNHHHQHNFTFRSTALNRLLEFSYGLHTGIVSNCWVLHHVLGHHVHYLDQSRDESRWQRKSGRTMGTLEYTLSVALTAYFRAYKVGRNYPERQRVFLGSALLTSGLVAGLLYHRPLPALFLFVLPMMCSLLFTAWVTYDHHAGLSTDDAFQASYNILNRWFNRLTGNLGYHTAHHHSGGLHWSKLPDLHARIADRIPAHLYRRSTFDVFLPDSPS